MFPVDVLLQCGSWPGSWLHIIKCSYCMACEVCSMSCATDCVKSATLVYIAMWFTLLTFAPSHIDLAGREAGAIAKQAEGMKKAKYSELSTTHHFIPVAVETSGVLGPEARNFLQELGQRIRETSGEPLSHSYLLQRIAVAVQRGNAAAVQGTSPPSTSDQIFFQWLMTIACRHVCAFWHD